jgi:hypothetical protein
MSMGGATINPSFRYCMGWMSSPLCLKMTSHNMDDSEPRIAILGPKSAPTMLE